MRGRSIRYRNGYAAQVWITTPEGRRQRKSVYGKTREVVHGKWLKLHEQARRGPVVPRSPALEEFLAGWLRRGRPPGPGAGDGRELRDVRPAVHRARPGPRKLEKLTVRDVQVWVNQLRVRCQCCAQGKDAAARAPRCCAVGAVLPPGRVGVDGAPGLDGAPRRAQRGHARGAGDEERGRAGPRALPRSAEADRLDCGRGAAVPRVGSQ